MTAITEVVEALKEVRQAVAALQEADFTTADELIKAKRRIASALEAAKVAGAGEAELLEASKPKVVEVENAGAAARKARKLRQLEKEVAEKEKFEREAQEKNKDGKDRAARLAEALAARRARAKGQDAEKAAAPAAAAASPAAASSAVPSADTNGNAKRPAAREETEPSRKRSRSPKRPAPPPPASLPAPELPKVAVPAVSPKAAVPTTVAVLEKAVDTGPAVPVLAEMLGKKKPSPAEQSLSSSSGAGLYKSMSELPVSVLMGGPAALSSLSMGGGARRVGADDLSTGGAQICYKFQMGRCAAWNCQFKHPGR